ncbi:MAG: site-specific integrase [Nitrososphaerota archaeon]|nr:site-specific integrase [Candidatus Bathyarchaeota archaeon]MDW8022615.1 site-specific integrase [Nitrososphaerota archaeon]
MNDQLIAACSRKISAFLQLLKETGIRSGEAWQLKWTDLDLANNTVRVTPEKGSEPRIFKISTKLAAMLNSLPKTSERIFGSSSLRTIRRLFQKQRQRIAQKLENPRLLNITFHTLRHWKATMEYHRTKDILHVMRILGHKNIKNTLIYTQLIPSSEDEYICKVAKTIEEAKKLIEAGFDYVCDIEDAKLFRKRK